MGSMSICLLSGGRRWSGLLLHSLLLLPPGRLLSSGRASWRVSTTFSCSGGARTARRRGTTTVLRVRVGCSECIA